MAENTHGVAGTPPAQRDDDEAYRQFQRDRIEEARRHDAEEARPKLTAGVAPSQAQQAKEGPT